MGVFRRTRRRLKDMGVDDELLAEEAARQRRQSDWIVPPAKMEKGEQVVEVDVKALDESWSKNKTFYVGEGGEGEIAAGAFIVGRSPNRQVLHGKARTVLREDRRGEAHRAGMMCAFERLVDGRVQAHPAAAQGHGR